MLKGEGIKLEAIVSIEMSGAYCGRIQGLLAHTISLITPEEFQECLKIMGDKTKTVNLYTINPIFFHIETLLILINDIEVNSRKQGLIQKVEIPEEGDAPTT
jgi:hypothetical protein